MNEYAILHVYVNVSGITGEKPAIVFHTQKETRLLVYKGKEWLSVGIEALKRIRVRKDSVYGQQT